LRSDFNSGKQEPQLVPARSRWPISCGEVKWCWRIAEQMLLRPTPKQEQMTAPISAEL
jgi:hypothetical protein